MSEGQNQRAVSSGNGLWIGVGTMLFCCIALMSCRQTSVDVVAPRPNGADASIAARLESGRAIYVSEAKCTRCHRPKPVCDYSPEKWTEKVLPKMAKMAKLTQREYDDVLAYVTSSAARKTP